MSLQNNKNSNLHYVGHRKRLKDKFIQSDGGGISDYELLELVLFQAIPRRDVKILAKHLLNEFSDFNGLINADKNKILSIEGATEGVYLQISIIKIMLGRIFKERVKKKNIISSWSALLDYLKITIGSLKIEQFRVLFLNKKNIMIADEIMGIGTIDQTPVYPREVVKKALFHEAAALILVHNHPSGNSKPSNADIDITTQIVNACKTINVEVHDHVIIGGNEYYSFKSNMLL